MVRPNGNVVLKQARQCADTLTHNDNGLLLHSKIETEGGERVNMVSSEFQARARKVYLDIGESLIVQVECPNKRWNQISRRIEFQKRAQHSYARAKKAWATSRILLPAHLIKG